MSSRQCKNSSAQANAALREGSRNEKIETHWLGVNLPRMPGDQRHGTRRLGRPDWDVQVRASSSPSRRENVSCLSSTARAAKTTSSPPALGGTRSTAAQASTLWK